MYRYRQGNNQHREKRVGPMQAVPFPVGAAPTQG